MIYNIQSQVTLQELRDKFTLSAETWCKWCICNICKHVYSIHRATNGLSDFDKREPTLMLLNEESNEKDLFSHFIHIKKAVFKWIYLFHASVSSVQQFLRYCVFDFYQQKDCLGCGILGPKRFRYQFLTTTDQSRKDIPSSQKMHWWDLTVFSCTSQTDWE